MLIVTETLFGLLHAQNLYIREGNIWERKQLDMTVFVRECRETKSDISAYYKKSIVHRQFKHKYKVANISLFIKRADCI